MSVPNHLEHLKQELLKLLAHSNASDYIERISTEYERYRREQFTLIKKVAQENPELVHHGIEKCIDENLYSANASRDVVDFLRRTEHNHII